MTEQAGIRSVSEPLVFPRVRRIRGAVARSSSWWGRAWVRSFEELALDAQDVVRARSLARSGRLGAVMVVDALASAVVDPGADEAVLAQIRVTRLDDTEWSGFEHELVRESGHLAALEAGQLPADLVEDADASGVELLPGPADLDTACECDAWAQPCVHALALLYQVAWLLDRDPYVLLHLRGRTRDQLVAAGTAPLEVSEHGAAEVADAAERARLVLALVTAAPSGHGLADSAVAAYDEAVSGLL